MRPEAWVFAGTVITVGPAYVALLVRKVHKQVNGQDETLSTMTLKTMQAVGRIEARLDTIDRDGTRLLREHIASHAGDGR